MNKLRLMLDKLMRILSATMLFVLTLLVVWQVITRYLLGSPSTWSEELSSYGFAWITLLGAAHVFGKREHMNIPVVVDRLSLETQKTLSIINEILVFIFASVILVYGGIEITNLTIEQMSSSLPFTMGYFYAIIPITGLFIMIYNVLNIYDIIKSDPLIQNENKDQEVK